MLRNAEFTRPETVRAAALHGQGGNEHGGSPWFKGAVEPGRAPAGEGRELLTPWVCGATPKLTPLTTLKLTPSWTLVKEGIWTTSGPIWLRCLTRRRTKRM